MIPTKTSKRQPADKDNGNPLNLLPDKQAKAAIWNKNTILLVGDSMINNIDEKKLGRRHQAKVCSFSGVTTTDLEDYLKPLVRKSPPRIILVLGNNDIQHGPSLSINGLRSYLDEVQLLMKELGIHIFALNETKLEPDYPQRLTKVNGYQQERLHRTSVGGGVSNYIRDCIKYNNNKGKTISRDLRVLQQETGHNTKTLQKDTGTRQKSQSLGDLLCL